MDKIKPYEIIYSKSDEPYPFQKYIDEKKHLDTDELRHLIQPTIHIIAQDFKGEEHKYCDKIQLCPLGKYKRPKVLVEAERRGFATVSEMVEADQSRASLVKKAEEEKKQKEIDELRQYKALSEERFDKMGRLIEQLLNKKS